MPKAPKAEALKTKKEKKKEKPKETELNGGGNEERERKKGGTKGGEADAVRKKKEKKKRNDEALARRDSGGTVFSIFQRDGYRVKFNAISRYIIPIILSRVIAYWTYGRAFIFRPLVPASVGSVIALFRAR